MQALVPPQAVGEGLQACHLVAQWDQVPRRLGVAERVQLQVAEKIPLNA